MYYILYGPLYILSLLPLRILYLLSDLLSFLIFRVFGYRRRVIYGNLAIAFPEKTMEEKKQVAKKFHRNFTDTFVETIKSLSAPGRFYDKHLKGDFSLFDEFAEQDISCQMHACHQFNWEWISLYWSVNFKQPLVVIYMPLSSKLLDKLSFKLRTKFGAIYLPATNSKTLLPWRKKTHALVLIADQKPPEPAGNYWLNFFGKPTPFIIGPERNAVLKKCPVVFGQAIKTARGKYTTSLKLACKDASLLKRGELTIMYRDYIEEVIRFQPDMYLWSHKRYKYEWKPEYGEIIG